jgi:hypothetical protein
MKNRWLAPAFVGVVLFGGALRIYRLHTAPPGLFFDEAANLFDIANVLNGSRPLYFPANNGREPFFFYWASLFASLLGNTPYSLRLAGAAIGTLTLPATFFCARELARAWKRDRRFADAVALISTFILSVTYFHLHYSRFGLRTISLPFFLALAFGFLFRSLRRGSTVAAAGSGLFGGLATYTYIASRVAPFLLIVLLIFAAIGPSLRRQIPRIILVGCIWAVMSLPLGVYYLRHPAAVEGHTDDVSILNSANNGGDPVAAVVHGIVATLGAIDVAGSTLWDQNLAGRPIFDPLLSVYFMVGLGAIAGSFAKRRRDGAEVECPPPTPLPRGDGTGSTLATASVPWDAEVEKPSAQAPRPLVAAFLVAWILDQAAPSMFSVNPPGYVRLTGILPAIAIVAGLGLVTFYRWLRQVRIGRVPALAGLAASLAISGGWTVRDYFFVWAPSAEAYNWMMAPKADAGSYLASISARERVFLAPLWAQDYTVRFMTRGAPIESFDLGQTLVVPTDRARDVGYYFPASDPQEAAQVAASLPGQSTESTIRDSSGRFPLLLRLSLRANQLPSPEPPLATFADGIGLIGASFDPPRIAPGGTVTVTLQWQSQQPARDDYTVFIHVRDASDATIAQADGKPGGGSFPTNAWRTGDLVWDRHRLALPTTAPPGDDRVVVGLYRLSDLKRLAAQAGSARAESDEVLVGTLHVSPP